MATIDEPAEAEEPTKPEVLASGGWYAPYDTLYDLAPGIMARRGGISFTAPPKPLEEWSKKELRERVKALQAREDGLVRSLNKERRRRRKAERKVKRLLKIIGRIS